MRRLAQRLDVSSTALYWHVSTKEDLLDLAVDHILGEVPIPEPGPDPRAAVRALLLGWRAAMLAHPWSPGLLGRPLLGPNVLARTEFVQAMLICAGLTGINLASATHLLTGFVIGTAMADATWRRLDDPAVVTKAREHILGRRELYPTLKHVRLRRPGVVRRRPLRPRPRTDPRHAGSGTPLTRRQKISRGRVDPPAARSTRGCESREAASPDKENVLPKYMLIMRGTDESNAAMMANIDEMMTTTRQFIEDLFKAGVYVAAEGLDDPGLGVVVDFSGETPVVTDGPYGETKELFGGFFLVDVASKQEAVEWAKRVPAAPGAKIEVRRVPGSDEVPEAGK